MEDIIPHMVHYIWLGDGEMNFILQQCVKTLPKLAKGIKIIRWDKYNIPRLPENIKWLFNNKKWAFVSDWIRLKVLYEYGGIYVDTDVQVRKMLPISFFEKDLVIGYANDNLVSTAFIMVKRHHPLIKELLDITKELPVGKIIVNNFLFTDTLLNYVNFRLDGKFREFSPNCFIYPRYYFDAPTYRKEGGFVIHQEMGTWRYSNKFRKMFRPLIKYLRFYIKPFGIWYKNRINRKMMDRSGKYLNIYKQTIAKEKETMSK